MIRLRSLFTGFAALLGVMSVSATAVACPFCSAVSQTFTEEITASEVAVFAKLVELPERGAGGAVAIDLNAAPAKAKFQITQVLKGESLLPTPNEIEVLYFGEAAVGTEFLILGIEPPVVVWSTPIEMSPRSREYINKVLTLPAEGPDRLAFFQNYLEDQEEMLKRDSYDEFAKSPFSVVKGLKDRMNHAQLVAWIWDSSTSASHRRLYFTMLSVCGGPNDVLMLETILKAQDRQVKLGLDSAIACYLTLKGTDGVALVEDLFFKNKDAEYTDTHAAIMALRFHAQEGDVLPKDRIKLAFRHMLEQPKLADLIIPDLARMNDWEVLDRMVRLFKEADAESSWVRVPVVNYLRACPLPEAKAAIEELAKIDPESVQHANNFYPLGTTTDPAATSRSGAEAAKSAAATADSSSESPAGEPTASAQPKASESDSPEVGTPSASVTPSSGGEQGAEAAVPATIAAAVQPAVQLAAAVPAEDPERLSIASDEAASQPTPSDAAQSETALAEASQSESADQTAGTSSAVLRFGAPVALTLLVLLTWGLLRSTRG